MTRLSFIRTTSHKLRSTVEQSPKFRSLRETWGVTVLANMKTCWNYISLNMMVSLEIKGKLLGISSVKYCESIIRLIESVLLVPSEAFPNAPTSTGLQQDGTIKHQSKIPDLSTNFLHSNKNELMFFDSLVPQFSFN